jgi:hypothetical protein
MWTDVSEERITSIFRVENQPRKKRSCSRWLGKISRINSTYGLHGAISQKMTTFITTAVRTSDPTNGSVADHLHRLCNVRQAGCRPSDTPSPWCRTDPRIREFAESRLHLFIPAFICLGYTRYIDGREVAEVPRRSTSNGILKTV